MKERKLRYRPYEMLTRNNSLYKKLESHGLHIYPKRKLKYQIPTNDQIQSLFGDKHQKAQNHVDSFLDFLDSLAISDQFGSDDDKRQNNYSNLETQLRAEIDNSQVCDFLIEMYVIKNQFKTNIHGIVAVQISMLANYTESNNPELSQQLQKIANNISTVTSIRDPQSNYVRNIPYNDLKDPDDKIKIIHRIEDAAIQTLNLLSKSRSSE